MTDYAFLTCYVDDAERVGLQIGDDLFALGDWLPSLDWMLSNLSPNELVERFLEAKGPRVDVRPGSTRLTLGPQEIWAAGVTYKRSEEARERESHNSTIYTRVYSAERPELFMKGLGYDAVSSGDSVGIRYDATWSVPEPELVVVLNARLEVIGFTLGNDMSSRDIEGDNPLYLPQAKIYEASCSVGPRIWLYPNRQTWPEVTIAMSISRAGQIVFEGETSTAALHRTLADLLAYLGRCKRFPHGVLLFTGTGIVPPDDFTLQEGDVIRIYGEPIGELVNTVRVIPPLYQPGAETTASTR